MHGRKAIREAFRQRLIGRTAAEDRVFASRLAPIRVGMLEDEGPALLIYVRGETIDPADYSITGEDGVARRRLEVTIEGVAIGSQTVDDVLDDLANEIEAALEDWDIPGYEAADPRLVESEIDVSEAFERPVGSCALTYVLNYYTPFRVRDPGTTPDDLFAEIQHSGRRELLIDGPGNGVIVDEAA